MHISPIQIFIASLEQKYGNTAIVVPEIFHLLQKIVLALTSDSNLVLEKERPVVCSNTAVSNFPSSPSPDSDPQIHP